MQELLTKIDRELETDYSDTVIAAARGDCVHFHEGYELVLGVRAANQCFLHDTGYPFADRTLIFIPARLLHIIKYKPGTPYTRYVANFSREFVQATLEAMGCPALLETLSAADCLCVQPSHQQYFTVHGLFQALHRCRQNEELPAARGYLSLLLLETARLLREHSARLPQSVSAPGQLVRSVVRYLDENFAQEISLEELSQRFFVSKYYLCHIFQAVIGSGVVDYLQCRRILEAQKLLMQGVSSREAAAQCGFHSMQHFYRVFRRVTGGPPGQYRMKDE